MTIRSVRSPFAPAATLVLLSLGCGGGSQQGDTCLGSSVVADERNNYSFSSTITLPPATVKAQSNLRFGWSALTKDFTGHSLSATADVNTVSVLIWQIPLATLEEKLNLDALDQSDLLVVPPPYTAPQAGATSAMLYDFTLNGTPVTPTQYNAYLDPAKYPASGYSYVVAAATGTELGRGIRMLQAFNLDPRATSTLVDVSDDSTRLTYSADLHSLAVTGVPAGTPAITLDWSMMKTNALGTEFKEGYVTSAIVGHFTQTPAELEMQFLDLEVIADTLYRADIPAGSVLDFTTLVDGNGTSFPGVDATGTWLVGLVCGVCRNPAPWYLTILRPCSAQ
jgi:hypothetical protein